MVFLWFSCGLPRFSYDLPEGTPGHGASHGEERYGLSIGPHKAATLGYPVFLSNQGVFVRWLLYCLYLDSFFQDDKDNWLEYFRIRYKWPRQHFTTFIPESQNSGRLHAWQSESWLPSGATQSIILLSRAKSETWQPFTYIIHICSKVIHVVSK